MENIFTSPKTTSDIVRNFNSLLTLRVISVNNEDQHSYWIASASDSKLYQLNMEKIVHPAAFNEIKTPFRSALAQIVFDIEKMANREKIKDAALELKKEIEKLKRASWLSVKVEEEIASEFAVFAKEHEAAVEKYIEEHQKYIDMGHAFSAPFSCIYRRLRNEVPWLILGVLQHEFDVELDCLIQKQSVLKATGKYERALSEESPFSIGNKNEDVRKVKRFCSYLIDNKIIGGNDDDLVSFFSGEEIGEARFHWLKDEYHLNYLLKSLIDSQASIQFPKRKNGRPHIPWKVIRKRFTNKERPLSEKLHMQASGKLPTYLIDALKLLM